MNTWASFHHAHSKFFTHKCFSGFTFDSPTTSRSSSVRLKSFLYSSDRLLYDGYRRLLYQALFFARSAGFTPDNLFESLSSSSRDLKEISGDSLVPDVDGRELCKQRVNILRTIDDEAARGVSDVCILSCSR